MAVSVMAASVQGRPATGDLPAAQQAHLNVSSVPEGAEVFVNNGLKGQTPLSLSLPEGKYELRLNLPGYFEWEAQVDISGETPLHIPMRPLQ